MRRLYTIAGWLPLGSVLMIVASVYSSWLIAFAQLERAPLPSMDDPKFIGGFATSFYGATSVITRWMLACWLAGMAFVLFRSFLPQTEDRRRVIIQATCGALAMAIFLGLFRYAPGGACEWFVD